MTNNIIQSILAIWIISLASTTSKFSCHAQGTTTIKNPTPLCAYPPPTTLPPPSTTVPPPAGTTTPPPSPPYSKPDHAVWCVAKQTIASSVMQQALDYACGFGADCGPIQAGGACYEPATLVAHASYAFNSYWQKNKKSGGTCDFGGSAMIVTVDPSHDQCHYIYG